MSGIGVVTNPRSRRNLRDPRMAERLAVLVGDRGEVAQPKDAAELLACARSFRERGIDVLAVNGGDGTIHAVLTTFLAVWEDTPLPPIVILPGGTMNNVAHEVRLRGSAEAVLARLLSHGAAFDAVPRLQRNLLCVPGDQPQYGFLFGNGLISNFLEVYYEAKEPSPLWAGWLLFLGVCSALVGGDLFRRLMRPVEVEVEVDGVAWPWRSYLTVTAGTMANMGLDFRPFPKAAQSPGFLQILGFACSPLRVVWELPRIRTARAPASPDIGNALGTRVTMKSNRPLAFMIDGDFHMGGDNLELRVGPAITILLP